MNKRLIQITTPKHSMIYNSIYVLLLPVDDSTLCHFELLEHAPRAGLQPWGDEGVGAPHGVAPQRPPAAQKKKHLSPTVWCRNLPRLQQLGGVAQAGLVQAAPGWTLYKFQHYSILTINFLSCCLLYLLIFSKLVFCSAVWIKIWSVGSCFFVNLCSVLCFFFSR